MPLIPIFLWFSVCLATGLLHTLFPNLFPSFGNAAIGAGYWVAGTYNNSKRLTQAILTYGTAVLIIWFSLIALSIHTKYWTFAMVAFISTGVAIGAVGLVTSIVEKVVTAGMTHLASTASAWSAKIPLRTMPWNAMPLPMKVWSLGLSPFYGLYLLLMLPAKGILEIAAAIGAFGKTLEKWMELLIQIMAAICLISWAATSIIVFQMAMGIVILDLYNLGLTLLFIAILIGLIFLHGKTLVSIKSFFQGLSFTALFMIGIVGFSRIFPTLAHNLRQNIQTMYNGVVNNTAEYGWIATIVTMIVLAVLAWIKPWCRSFATPLIGFVLFLYVFSTNFASEFYKNTIWWLPVISGVLLLLLTFRWKTPDPAHDSTPSGGSTASAKNDAGHGHHGGDHGGHGFPWVWILGIIFAGIFMYFLYMMSTRNSTASPTAQANGGTVITPVVHATTVPGNTQPTAAEIAVLPPTPSELTNESVEGGRKITWPTRSSEWVKVAEVSEGQTVTADPEGKIWCFPKYGVIGPAGLDFLPAQSNLPVPKAPACSVVAKLGEDGNPQALFGKYGNPLRAERDTILYVRINDLPQTPTETGVGGDWGSLPVIIKNKEEN